VPATQSKSKLGVGPEAFDFTTLGSGRTGKAPQQVRKCTNLLWSDLDHGQGFVREKRNKREREKDSSSLSSLFLTLSTRLKQLVDLVYTLRLVQEVGAPTSSEGIP
jgi:hypothetical protein